MRTLILSSLALFAAAAAPGQASADDVGDRSQAIRLCRTQVAEQAGVDLDRVRFDQVRVRPHSVRVDIDLWRGRELSNVRCEVTRGETLAIASIVPAVTTATAQAN